MGVQIGRPCESDYLIFTDLPDDRFGSSPPASGTGGAEAAPGAAAGPQVMVDVFGVLFSVNDALIPRSLVAIEPLIPIAPETVTWLTFTVAPVGTSPIGQGFADVEFPILAAEPFAPPTTIFSFSLCKI